MVNVKISFGLLVEGSGFRVKNMEMSSVATTQGSGPSVWALNMKIFISGSNMKISFGATWRGLRIQSGKYGDVIWATVEGLGSSVQGRT